MTGFFQVWTYSWMRHIIISEVMLLIALLLQTFLVYTKNTIKEMHKAFYDKKSKSARAIFEHNVNLVKYRVRILDRSSTSTPSGPRRRLGV